MRRVSAASPDAAYVIFYQVSTESTCMEFDRYCEAVAERGESAGFEALEHANPFERAWHTSDDDPTVGEVSLFTAVVDAREHGPDDVVETADEFRRVVTTNTHPDDGATPIGYVVFVVPDPSSDVVDAATSYTVAERRTSVFPLVYDAASETLHTHPVPRLKGRGIYRRQIDDAARLLEPSSDEE